MKLAIYVTAAGLTLLVIGSSIATVEAQSFDTLDKSLQNGMLVSLTSNTNVIEPAYAQNSASLVGVVAPEEQNSLSTPTGQTNVTTNGAATALVSTVAGDVRVGDRITASAIEGIGAKATRSGYIVGIAQGSIDANTLGAQTAQVSDSAGNQRSIKIMSIPIVVKPTYYTVPTKAVVQKDSIVPKNVQTIVDKLAGKHVSPLALVLSFILFLAGIMVAALIINASIRGGFAAIARQPLSKKFILRKIAQSFAIAIGIVIGMSVASLALLRIL